MKRFTTWLTLVWVGFAPAWAVAQGTKAATSEGVAGNWQGVLKATPQIELRITLEIAKEKDGSFSGTWGSPDEGVTKQSPRVHRPEGRLLDVSPRSRA